MTPQNEMLVALSAWSFGSAFFAYCASSLLYLVGLAGNRTRSGSQPVRSIAWAPRVHLLGVLLHLAAVLARWQGSGHWPLSNMYEFIGFLALTSMIAFQVINRIFQLPMLGALLSPLGVFLMAYAYVFPTAVQPLVPALRSHWMPLHVGTVALSGGFYAVAFGAAMIYLLRARALELVAAGQTGEMRAMAVGGTLAGATVNMASEREQRWHVRLMEILIYLVSVYIGFVLLANLLRHLGFQWLFDSTTYHLPPIIGPAGEAMGSKGRLLGLIPLPLMGAPDGWRGKNLNTLLYALGIGGLIYWSLRRLLAGGQPLGDRLALLARGQLDTWDEISYRAIAIGYPLYTLGGLIFAMFWAKEAWGRYWFWDPKETWALITWLVYSAYLHLRITRGWQGRTAAWVAVLGFGVVLFTMAGVNLLIVGLHAYAGGD